MNLDAQTTSEVLNRLDNIYSTAFGWLILITISVVTLIGVVVPMVLAYLQRRSFSDERDVIIDSLNKSLNASVAKLMSEFEEAIDNRIKELFCESEKRINTRIKQIEDKLNKEIASSMGRIYHIQGGISEEEENFIDAAESYTWAASFYIEANEGLNLNRTLSCLAENVLPKMNKNMFSDNQSLKDDFNDMIDMLKKFDNSGFFEDKIIELRSNFRSAIIR